METMTMPEDKFIGRIDALNLHYNESQYKRPTHPAAEE